MQNSSSIPTKDITQAMAGSQGQVTVPLQGIKMTLLGSSTGPKGLTLFRKLEPSRAAGWIEAAGKDSGLFSGNLIGDYADAAIGKCDRHVASGAKCLFLPVIDNEERP